MKLAPPPDSNVCKHTSSHELTKISMTKRTAELWPDVAMGELIGGKISVCAVCRTLMFIPLANLERILICQL